MTQGTCYCKIDGDANELVSYDLPALALPVCRLAEPSLPGRPPVKNKTDYSINSLI